jgi:hypothetical protein
MDYDSTVMMNNELNAVRETDAEYAARVVKMAQKMYTVEDIASIYKSTTGRYIADDVPEFLDELQQRIR